MANINDIHSIIVPANAPNFSAHTYTEIYGGTTGCTMTLNGVSVTMAAQSNIKIWVRTLSGGAGCYLLGENQNVFQGSPYMGNPE
jgi:hypothetical protein